jgi:hypothetical protein
LRVLTYSDDELFTQVVRDALGPGADLSLEPTTSLDDSADRDVAAVFVDGSSEVIAHLTPPSGSHAPTIVVFDDAPSDVHCPAGAAVYVRRAELRELAPLLVPLSAAFSSQ